MTGCLSRQKCILFLSNVTSIDSKGPRSGSILSEVLFVLLYTVIISDDKNRNPRGAFVGPEYTTKVAEFSCTLCSICLKGHTFILFKQIKKPRSLPQVVQSV